MFTEDGGENLSGGEGELAVELKQPFPRGWGVLFTRHCAWSVRGALPARAGEPHLPQLTGQAAERPAAVSPVLRATPSLLTLRLGETFSAGGGFGVGQRV